MVYLVQFHISMPGYSSFTYTAIYLSGIQYILAYLLIANHALSHVEERNYHWYGGKTITISYGKYKYYIFEE